MDTPISARAAILAVLIPGRSFGLEIIDRVRERTDEAIKLNEGTVYPTGASPFIPPADLQPGERFKVTVRFADGAAPTSATFMLK